MPSAQHRWGSGAVVLFLLFLTELALLVYGATYGRALHRGMMDLTGITSIGLHISAFAVVTITALLMWERSLKLFGALALLAIGLEVVQIFLPNRDAYVSDAAASLTGIFLGGVISIGFRALREKVKRRGSAPRSSTP